MSELPEPLVPAEVDLRAFPYAMLDVRAASWVLAIGTAEESCAAFTLWLQAWLQLPGGSLPNDERELARLSGANRKWRGVRAYALKGWVLCSDGRLYHPEVTKMAARAWKNQRHRHAALRLKSPERIKGLRWEKIRNRILARDGAICAKCGTESGPMEIDHIHPLAEGGNHDDRNLQVLCRPCNRRKSFKVAA